MRYIETDPLLSSFPFPFEGLPSVNAYQEFQPTNFRGNDKKETKLGPVTVRSVTWLRDNLQVKGEC